MVKVIFQYKKSFFVSIPSNTHNGAGGLMNNALRYLNYAKYATLGALGGVSLLGSVLMLLSIPMAQSGLEGTAMILGGIGGTIVAKVAHLV